MKTLIAALRRIAKKIRSFPPPLPPVVIPVPPTNQDIPERPDIETSPPNGDSSTNQDSPPIDVRVVRRAFDISNWWLPGPVSDEEARRLMASAKEQGYSGVSCGTQVPSLTNQQVHAALDSGLWADAYWYVRFDRDLDDQMAAARWALDDVLDRIGLVWIDLEQDPGMTPARVVDLIHYMCEGLVARGMRPAIYTRGSWWVPFTGDSRAFSGLPLIVAEYNDPYELTGDWWAGHSFGGWGMPVWRQWAEGRDVGGMNADELVGPA